jgi:hypothetical protein
MGAEAHPRGVRAQVEEGGLCAELAEESALGMGFGGGTGLVGRKARRGNGLNHVKAAATGRSAT